MLVPSSYFPQPLSNGNLVFIRTIPKMVNAFRRRLFPPFTIPPFTIPSFPLPSVSDPTVYDPTVYDPTVYHPKSAHHESSFSWTPIHKCRRFSCCHSPVWRDALRHDGYWVFDEWWGGAGDSMVEVYNDMWLHGEVQARSTRRHLLQASCSLDARALHPSRHETCITLNGFEGCLMALADGAG